MSDEPIQRTRRLKPPVARRPKYPADELERISEKQDHKCAICGESKRGKLVPWSGGTSTIRAAVCNSCSVHLNTKTYDELIAMANRAYDRGDLFFTLAEWCRPPSPAQ